MKKYTILAMNDKVTIVTTLDNDKMYACANGKLYDVATGESVDNAGTYLRQTTKDNIKSLLPEAYTALQELKEQETKKVEGYFNDGFERGQREVEPKQKTFAESLEEAFLHTLSEKSTESVVEVAYPAIEKMLIDKFGIIPVQHEIKIPDRPNWTTTEILHKDFDRILNIVLDGEAIYLCGAAGTGKSYLAQQVASALNLEYYYTNSVTDEVQLKGFVDANGRYHETQFYKAFTEGGVFLLDELDASIPETLVMLNNALANGYFAFPNGKAEAHKDFHCIAAGNTYGTGADDKYVGRYQLDASSMDRFALITIDYDEVIESSLANGDEELVKFARAYREALDKIGINSLCTYRAIKRLAKFDQYMDKEDALRIGLLKGMCGDDVELINRNVNVSSNNYWKKALCELCK